mmetsp:Transcript_4760/g.7223  ORF Transcript_4760/g.7223 Transcript_4760/m.7223 type:complete len:163 (+) Transcript_4760:50-538(+)
MESPPQEEKEYTLVFCRRKLSNGDQEVLLGMKKRGFGVGKWNGFGGKLEEGESNEAAALRELEEECSVTSSALSRQGYLVFSMEESNKLMKVHVFETWEFSGEPSESSEMRPQWFNESNIPYDSMWPDDKYWLPLLLAGKKFIGRFDYSDEETIEDFSVREQ